MNQPQARFLRAIKVNVQRMNVCSQKNTPQLSTGLAHPKQYNQQGIYDYFCTAGVNFFSCCLS